MAYQTVCESFGEMSMVELSAFELCHGKWRKDGTFFTFYSLKSIHHLLLLVAISSLLQIKVG